MEERETIQNTASTETVSPTEDQNTALTINKESLDKESLEIINQIIAESDISKTKDLTYLFNLNQNKKTMVRVNKLNELLDIIADRAIDRFTKKPDEISNQELLQGLKVVQDIVERGQRQVAGVNETPLIQVNNQTNEINIGNDGETLSKESRDRVKNAVMAILSGITEQNAQPKEEPIDLEVKEAPSTEEDVSLVDAEGED